MRHVCKLWPRVLCFSVTAVVATAGKVVAQEQPSAAGGLEEVVVTATRREESIQAVPLSITAVTQSALEGRAATNFFDYGSAIPNLSFGYSGSGNSAGVSNSRTIGSKSPISVTRHGVCR